MDMRMLLVCIILTFTFLSCDACRQQKSCLECKMCNCDKISCTNMVSSSGNDSACVLRQVLGEEMKGIVLQPSLNIYPAKSRPFVLRPFAFEFFNSSRTSFNISFSNLNSPNRKYKFRFRDSSKFQQEESHEFVLSNLRGAHSVFWDCLVFKDYEGNTSTLTIIDDDNSGGEYTFRVPEAKRIIPGQTLISEWQLFFMIDVGVLKKGLGILVTLQLPPFQNVECHVYLHSCHKEDACFHGDHIDKHLVNCSGIETLKPSQKSLTFDHPGPGYYQVTMHISNGNCDKDGCYQSQSPIIEIKSTYLWVTIVCTTFGVVLLGMLLLMMLIWRYKEIKRKLHKEPVSLLVVYLPETDSHYYLVKTLADFLENHCGVRTHMVDRDAIQQDPHKWTEHYMEISHRVVFLVPSACTSQSSRPIQEQWHSTLRLFDHTWSFQDNSNKFAVILIPSLSSSVPTEIASLRRFTLLEDMISLVNWIHPVTQPGRLLLWHPALKLKKSKTSLYDLEDCIRKTIAQER